MQRGWNESEICAARCLRGKTHLRFATWTTGFTGGKPRSVPFRAKVRDSVKQFGERVDPQGRQPVDVRVMLLDTPPRPPPDQRGSHPGGGGRAV
jgi:hypothetical protein